MIGKLKRKPGPIITEFTNCTDCVEITKIIKTIYSGEILKDKLLGRNENIEKFYDIWIIYWNSAISTQSYSFSTDVSLISIF